MKPPYQICNRCVMDTSDVDIQFDEKGNCNHCNNFFKKISAQLYDESKAEESRKALENQINSIKESGKNNTFDCIIGVSGGVDSSYVAYLAKNYGLKPLLVHLDNGWDSTVSTENIRFLADKLEFEYMSYTLDWEEFKDLQLSFLKASVPEMETPTDIVVPAVLHKIAAQHNIKYIISGGNFATEGILPKTWSYDAKDLQYLLGIHKKFGTKKLKTFPKFGWKEELYYKIVKKIKMFYILNLVPFDKEKAMKILETELGWKYYGGKHYESIYTGFVQSYIMPRKFNMDYRRATLSTQICHGQTTRELALKELQQKPYNDETIEKQKVAVCEKLNISIADFEKFMQEPPKMYRDYPNNEKFLQFIYKSYLKLTGKTNYREDL